MERKDYKMDLDARIGIALVSFGTVLNIAGAVLNAMHLQMAYFVWIIGNAFCGAYFFGAWRGLWKIDKTGDLQMLGMYSLFICTSIVGALFY